MRLADFRVYGLSYADVVYWFSQTVPDVINRLFLTASLRFLCCHLDSLKPSTRFDNVLTVFITVSPSLSLARYPMMRGSTFTSSTSTEELPAAEHVSVSELADSGRGSWTSCSSNSHDNLQTLPGQRALDLLNHRHTPMCGPIAEVPGLAEDSCSELGHSRQSWTSSSSLSDTYEGAYGTIKRRAGDQTASDGQSADSAYKMITSSTEKGLIGEIFLRVLSCWFLWKMTQADFTTRWD